MKNTDSTLDPAVQVPHMQMSPEAANSTVPLGQALRRGPLAPGDRVQITDPKGRMHTVVLVPGGQFRSNRGTLLHDDVLGRSDGQVVTVEDGRTFQVIRPLLADYVLSIPRGAAIIYPKDAAQIVQMGDIFPGAEVLEAGVGSGALSLSLLAAVGETGSLHSIERREDFASIAKANVDLWYGTQHPAWTLEVSDLADALERAEAESYDRVVLDLLDPWSFVEQVACIMRPGGVLICYITTVPQLSRVVEALRDTGEFSEPQAWDSTNRPWHVEGLAVRPEHRMIGHTGYLVTARRLAQYTPEHVLVRHPAPAAEGSTGGWDTRDSWDEETLGHRTISDKKVRRVRRDLEARAERWVTGEQNAGGPADDG